MRQQRTHMDEWASLLDEEVPDEVVDALRECGLGRDVEESWSA